MDDVVKKLIDLGGTYGGKILLVVCEEGEEEYDTSPNPNKKKDEADQYVSDRHQEMEKFEVRSSEFEDWSSAALSRSEQTRA